MHENIFWLSLRYNRYNLYRITWFCNKNKKPRTDHVTLTVCPFTLVSWLSSHLLHPLQLLHLSIWFCLSPTDGATAGSLPDEIFQLRHLEELELQYQAITTISSRIGQLRSLRSLNLSHCLRLESLPGALGELPNLQCELSWSIGLLTDLSS